MCAREDARPSGIGGIRSSYLEAFSPIAGATLGMGDGNDLDIVQALAKDHRKRIAIEDYAAGAVQIGRTHVRTVPNEVEGRNQFFEKPIACLGTLSAIPVVR